jgi:hypothetical protein
VPVKDSHPLPDGRRRDPSDSGTECPGYRREGKRLIGDCGRRAEPVRFLLSMKNRRVALNAITRLLPFDCRGRFGRDVVDDSVYSTHLIDDSIGNSRKQVGW